MIRLSSRSRSSSALRSRCTAARASRCARRAVSSANSRAFSSAIAAWLAKSCSRPISSAPKVRPVTSPTASTPVTRPPMVSGTASTEPCPARSTSARVSAFSTTRGSARTSGVETAAPSRTASPAISSSPGMTVPGEKTPLAPEAATATSRPETGSSSHRTDTVPPSSVRIPSAMCRPTLAPSSDCTRARPTADSAAASRRAVCSRAITAAWSRSMLRRSVRSRRTSTAPTTSPCGSRTGAPLSSMGRTCPSRRTSRVLGRPVRPPSRITRTTGLSTGARVSSPTSEQTSASRRPRASSARQPMRRSAAAFMKVTRSAASVTTTASPMLASVTASSSCCSRTRSSARRRPAAAAQIPAATTRKSSVRIRSSP